MKPIILAALIFAGCGGSESGTAPVPPPVDGKALPSRAQPAAPAPSDQATNMPSDDDNLACSLVFSEGIANQTFQIIGANAPEGCKFEGLSTKHSQMFVRWETPPYQADNSAKKIVDFVIVPSACAKEYDVDPSGSNLSTKPIGNAATACPNQWAQLVRLTQADELPKAASARTSKAPHTKP